MNHGELVELCVAVFDTQRESFLSPEDHLKDFLDTNGLNDVDATFVSEVYSGLLRYKDVSTVVSEPFLQTAGKSVSKSNKILLDVMTYIGLFRLDEIGMPHYKRFIRSQDFNVMYRYLKFFAKESSLKSWMRDEWSKLYDTTFVQTTLLSPFLRWLPEILELVDELRNKVDGKNNPPRKEIPLTKVQEFNLTKPKARSVPLPQPIPKLQKHKPVPRAVYDQPREQDVLLEKKVMNRREAERRLMESSKKQFSCADPSKSQKTVEKLDKIRQLEDGKLQFDSYRAKPLSKEVMGTDVPIKLNAATIMREGKLFKDREKEVIKKLELLEAGAHDPSKFLKWQNEMRQKDLEAELAAIERRRIEGKLSHEEAILARQKLISTNQRRVDDMKQETRELMQRYLEEKEDEQQLMRSLVDTVMNGRENAKDAKKKLVQLKSKIVQEVNEESKELMRQALEEAEEEMKRKVELIHQIRAMEAAPISRNKLVDFTETAGYRFLNEMCIAELKERLSLLKEKKAEEEEHRRTNILANKQAKDRMLMDTLNVISKHRAEDTRAKATQRVTEKVGKDDSKNKLLQNDQNLMSLQEKLEQKKAERLALQQKERSRTSKKSNSFISGEKSKIEEKRWSELEKTKKRMATLHAEGSLDKTAGRLTAPNGSRLAANSRPFIMT